MGITNCNLRKVISIVFLFILWSPSGLVFALTAESIFSKVSKSIVIVVAMNENGLPLGQGSGVVVAPNKVITNWHVIEDATSVLISQNGTNYPAEVLADRRNHDLVAIRVSGLSASPIDMSGVRGVIVGQPVYAIGAPQGLELTISNGIVSSLRDIDGSKIIQTNAALSPGSSGGGLFNEDGLLIGVTTFKFNGENLNFALPVDWVKELVLEEDSSFSWQFLPYLKIVAGILFVFLLLGFRSRISNYLSQLISRPIVPDQSQLALNKVTLNNEKRGLDRYYPLVQEELDKNIKEGSLWIDACAASNGNSDTANAIYIQLRAKVLQKHDSDKRWQLAANAAKNDMLTHTSFPNISSTSKVEPGSPPVLDQNTLKIILVVTMVIFCVAAFIAVLTI